MCEEQDVCDRAVSSLLLPSTAVAGVKPSLGGRAGERAALCLNKEEPEFSIVTLGLDTDLLAAWLSAMEWLATADGRAGRPGCFQKVTQWNDASKT